MAPKPKLLRPGVAFRHPVHGSCAILGEWTFDVDVDLDVERPRKLLKVYFALEGVSEESKADSNQWDDTEGIMHEESTKVRYCIMRPTPELSRKYDATAELRQENMKKHAVFLELGSWTTSAFAKELKLLNKEAYKKAKGKVADLLVDLEERPDVASVLMRSLVCHFALLCDDMRNKLKPTRPRSMVPGESRAWAKTLTISLDDNQADYFEVALAMSGFVENPETGEWLPLSVESVERMFGSHTHATGVNILRRMWCFTPLDINTWREESGEVASEGALNNPHEATESAIYKQAPREIESGAFDGGDPTAEPPVPPAMLPAWLLRSTIEDRWIEKKDPRMKAHAEVLLESVKVVVMGKKVAGPGMTRPFMGAVVHVEFEWQGWARKNSPGDEPAPLFESHVARALERA